MSHKVSLFCEIPSCFISFVISENETFLNVFQPLCSISNRLWKRSSESPNHGVLKVVEGKQYSQVLLLQMVRMHNQWTPFYCVYSLTQPIQQSNFFCLWPKSVHPRRDYTEWWFLLRKYVVYGTVLFFQLLPSFWQIVSHRTTLIIILLPTLAIFIAALVLTLQIIPILSLDIIPLLFWQDSTYSSSVLSNGLHKNTEGK